MRCTLPLAAVAALIAFCAAASPLAGGDQALPTPHYRSTRLVAGWMPYWLNKSGQGDGWKTVESNLGLLDQVSFFSGEVDEATGAIKLNLGGTPQSINAEIATLHEHDIDALLTITRMNHVHELLANPAAVQALESNIAAAIDQYNFDGIDIDFEDFHDKAPGDAASYASLLERLAQRLHARPDSFGYPTSVIATVLAHTERGRFTFADEATLANSDIDQVRIMAYDQNWPGSKTAGADAPLPWVQSVAAYLRGTDAPSWKFVFGIPAYGDRWPVNSPTDWTTLAKGASVTYPKAVAQMRQYHVSPQWSETDSAPYLSYHDAATGHDVIAFYENARSWQTKLATVIAPETSPQPPLGGIAEWALGYEDPSAWHAVAAELASPWPVYSAIGGCYTRFGGGARFGEAVTGERDAGPFASRYWNEREGRTQEFERAMLYYKWDTPRAYFVERPILERYLNAGGPNGALGFPTGDPIIDKTRGTVTQTFEHGRILARARLSVATAQTNNAHLQPDWKKFAAEVAVGGALYAGARRAASAKGQA